MLTPAPDGRRRRRARPKWPTATFDSQAWRRAAACRDTAAETFFTAGGADTDRAKTYCAACPVQGPCLQFAFATNQEYGVWGGLDEDERRALRRQWRSAAGT